MRYTMKKLKQLIAFFNTERQSNENEILYLLLNQDFEPLSTCQSIALMQNIKDKFDKVILSREMDSKNELKSIESYRLTKAERLKKIIKDPVFDIPVQNFEFVKSN